MSTQQKFQKLKIICLVGLLAIGLAWGLRQQKIRSSTPLTQVIPPPVASTILNPPSDKATNQSQVTTDLTATARAAVAQAPKDVNKRWQLADAYQKVGQLDKAAQELQTITRLTPHDLDAHTALAKVDLALQNFKGAETTYIFLVQQAPHNAAAWIGLAGALYHQGSYYEASEAARRSVTLQPNDSARYVLALCLMKCGLQVPNLDTGLYFAQLQEARDGLEHLAKVWPQNGDIYYCLGKTYLGMSDGKNAVKNLLRAHEIMPHKPDVHLQLAKAYIKLGDTDNALKVVEAAMQQFPAAASLWNLRGQLYLNQSAEDALPKAQESCQQAVRLAPGAPLYHDRLGVAYQRSGKLVEACQEFEAEVRLNPHNIFPYQQLAMLYRRRRDNAKATVYAQRASTLVTAEQRLKQLQIQSRDHPANVSLHLAIADHFRDIRYTGAARDEYLRAIKLDPTNVHARQGLAALTPTLAREQQVRKSAP